MIAFGMLIAAAFGTTTFADGLACTPTSPASLGVSIGQGSIISLQTVDPNAYGTLGTNGANLMKMGINVAATTVSLTGLVPTTPGQSCNVLIEGQFLESDGSPVILPYYNSANPSSPLAGPGGAGTAQNTRRTQTVNLRVKAGASAPTGAQPTPAADPGCAALWIVTLTYGQSTVLAGNIAQAPNAPFIGTKLGALPQKLTAPLTLYVTTSGNDSANNGLSTASAFATPQAAVNALNNYNLNGFGVTINVGAGTFGPVNRTGLFTGQTGPINIVGAGAGVTTIAGGSSAALQVNQGGNVGISNATLTGSSGISSNSSANINVNAGTAFGSCTFAHMLASGGVITLGSNYSITGNAPSHYLGFLAGSINVFGSITVTTVGTPSFSGAFCTMTGAGWSSALGTVTFAGSGATGVRFTATGGGFINTATNGNMNYFPGSVAGSLGSGNNIGFYN